MKKSKFLLVLTALVLAVAVTAACSLSAAASVTEESKIGFTGPGYDDYFEDSTGHCVEWSEYTLTQESNYCEDNKAFSGYLEGEHTLNFTAPEDLEIVSFGFTLFHDYPGVTLDSYKTFTDMKCETAEDNLWMLKGECAFSSSVPVKKGEPLLTADVSVNMSNSDYGYNTGIETVVYFSVDWLVVKTADGYKTVVGDEDETQPATYEPYDPSFPEIATTTPEAVTEQATGAVNPTNPDYQEIIGDANSDGAVDVLDASLVQKYSADKAQLTPEQVYAADVNNDGIADTLDALMIQKLAAGKITGFSNP